MTIEAKQIAEAFSGIVDIQRHLVGMGRKAPSIAERILKSDEYANFNIGSNMARFSLTPMEFKTAIIGAGTINDPLGASMKPAIDPGTRQALQIRDLIPWFPTQNNAIEMPVKTAANTGSPIMQSGQNTGLAESGYTFTDSFIPVETIGHWVPVSSQIFEDSGSLDALISSELLHGLGVNVQDQILNGDGVGHSLTGLIDNSPAWGNESPNITNEIDIVRSAIKQIENAKFNASAIVLNCDDWFDIETRKAGASDDAYAAGQPRNAAGPSLWGLPVISTPSIARGTFLVADFNRAAILFDHQEPMVEIARHDGDNFRKGMLTIKATERLALVVTNPLAMVTGSL